LKAHLKKLSNLDGFILPCKKIFCNFSIFFVFVIFLGAAALHWFQQRLSAGEQTDPPESAFFKIFIYLKQMPQRMQNLQRCIGGSGAAASAARKKRRCFFRGGSIGHRPLRCAESFFCQGRLNFWPIIVYNNAM